MQMDTEIKSRNLLSITTLQPLDPFHGWKGIDLPVEDIQTQDLVGNVQHLLGRLDA